MPVFSCIPGCGLSGSQKHLNWTIFCWSIWGKDKVSWRSQKKGYSSGFFGLEIISFATPKNEMQVSLIQKLAWIFFECKVMLSNVLPYTLRAKSLKIGRAKAPKGSKGSSPFSTFFRGPAHAQPTGDASLFRIFLDPGAPKVFLPKVLKLKKHQNMYHLQLVKFHMGIHHLQGQKKQLVRFHMRQLQILDFKGTKTTSKVGP